jgi:glyoxylase-like metal-dependent hydrolase (beta-lactamase superfamily II)
VVCGDYLSPVEIPMISESGSAGAYLATLERLRPLVEQAEHVIPGHGSPLARGDALRILDEDLAYIKALPDAELPSARRTAAQDKIHAENVSRC